MSLFSSIQVANNALRSAQIGLEVTGNNIANANTPGYLRQEMVLTPAQTQQNGNLLLGMGVHIEAIVQKSDAFLEERLRGAASELANGETQEETYVQLEQLIGELSDTDISSSMNRFFGSIHDILNEPDSHAVRNLAILQGETLADDIKRLDQQVRNVRENVNNQIESTAGSINSLLKKIADLNVKIVTAEGGSSLSSDAVGLRDQRLTALNELAQLIDINAIEQPDGSMSVFSEGDYLAFAGVYREVETELGDDRGLSTYSIRIKDTKAPLSTTSGELAGLINSRDEILGGFLDQLDEFAKSLAYEFNKVFSSGQGITGYSNLTSEFSVSDTTASLANAGLTFEPINGSFQVLVRNTQTGITETTDIFVPINGADDDLSLDDLAAALDAVDGISAQVDPDRRLQLNADSQNLEFSFAKDTSGVLASLGLNTFFSGDSSNTIGINQRIKDDPSKFAASQQGIGADTKNAEILATFLEYTLDEKGGTTLSQIYEELTGETTQAASVARSVAEGFRVFHNTLEGQKLAVSGVNLDEETVNMLSFQKVYQANARYIQTINELLEVLVTL
ncbi:MAG: flagellar hook-associated protein FlgK [Pirellulaceae bacterium]|nr:flagellar hook-associated protein FlgK [Pirellulaceae bacterium]